MPRGRPINKQKDKKMNEELLAGPDESVAERIEENSNEIKTLKKKIAAKKALEPTKVQKRAKILFRNLEDPGFNIEFTYNGKYFNMVDGKEQDVPMYVVDHLNSLTVRKSRYEKDRAGNVRNIDELKPRVYCQVLETYEKAV